MTSVPVDSLAVGVFGHLSADERVWAAEGDCFSAFHALSSVMGHLASARPEDPSAGLWGMNDAGGPWLGPGSRDRRGQFQVFPASGTILPLPIEPFTVAAVAAVERFGALALHGLEYYLPLSLAGSGSRRITDGHGWFALASPDARTPLTVTLDSGESTAVVDRRHELVDAVNAVAPHDEELEAALLDDAAVDFTDPVPWRWWLGEGPPHTVTLSATATEWTPLALGRVVGLLSEACRQVDIAEHIGVRVARATTT